MPTPDLRAISLRRLFPTASFIGCGDIAVGSVTDRHDQCAPGDLFAVIRGSRFDGTRFVPAAVAAGATSVLVDRPLVGVNVPQCVVPDVRAAFSRLCLALKGNPQRNLHITGVTGTNGKTTVTWLIRAITQAASRSCGVVGTIEYSNGNDVLPASLTTPGPTDFADLTAEMVQLGTTHAAVELSSHALHQQRLAGLTLNAAVVTNITQDHFDYHENQESYRAAKARIADHCLPDAPIIVNADDEGCQQLVERFQSRNLVSFGLNPGAASRGIVIEATPGSTVVRFEVLGEVFEARLNLIGRHNVSNCVAAATVAHLAGVSGELIAAGLSSLRCVPGRLQSIDRGQSFRVFVDYAHTPDAVSQVIAALRPTTAKRLICVVGAGGDRDSSKRPQLGTAASQADIVVVTSDNPRSENPAEIAAAVQDGVTADLCRVELDRAAAIRWAIETAEPGDCVLLAGKGHENTQQIGNTTVPFDDREVAAAVLSSIRTNATTRAA